MSTPAPTDLIRAYEAIRPRQLYKAFKAQLPYDRIGEVWNAMDPGQSDTARNVKLCLKTWIPGRYRIAPKGTYVYLLDYPHLRVSLMNGGIYDGWSRGRKTKRWGLFLTAAIIFRLLPDDFPALFEIVAGTVDRIRSGDLRFPDSSHEEIRAYFGALKSELLPYWTQAGLVTTVLRKAPTATKLWKAIPPEFFPSAAYLLDFLRECRIEENETVFRLTEKISGPRNVRWLLEVTELR
jgi:hypothetical protein